MERLQLASIKDHALAFKLCNYDTQHGQEKNRLKNKGWRESRLDRALFYLNIKGVTVAVMMSHVDDFLLAYDSRNKEVAKIMAELSKELHLVRNDAANWEYCGKMISVTPGCFRITCPKSLRSLEKVTSHGGAHKSQTEV